MPLTPNSSPTPYLTVVEFFTFADDYLIAELSLNGGDLTSANPSDTDLQTNAVVLAALGAASGQVESSLVKGGRYAPTDLAVLIGNSLTFLKGLTAAIALQWLRDKRGNVDDPLPSYVRAMKVLEALENGGQVFAFAETEAAGLPKTAAMTAQDYDALNLTSRNVRFMGVRQNMLGRPGGGYGNGW